MEDRRDTTPAARGARRREQTRTSILEAAERLLTEMPPQDLRIQDVARVAGVSEGSIYGHFGTKDALVAAVFDRLVAAAAVTLSEAYQSDASPFEQIEAAGAAYLKLLLDHPAISVLLLASMGVGAESEVKAQVARYVPPFRQEFEKAIQAAIDCGQIRGHDARLMSHALVASWTATAALASGSGLDARLTPEEVGRAVGQLRGFLMDGWRRGHA